MEQFLFTYFSGMVEILPYGYGYPDITVQVSYQYFSLGSIENIRYDCDIFGTVNFINEQTNMW
ncbi:hypothetical protein QTP88_028699 [Uroleucon formosanum]